MKQLLFIAILLSSFGVNAASFSFTGNLENDDAYQWFNFSVSEGSWVTLRTWSSEGGKNAAGDLIDSGGFDPVLVLFENDGIWMDMNDDIDGQNGVYDSLLTWYLEAGNYIVALAQSGHDLADMPQLAEAFLGVYGSGETNFNSLSSRWALDIEGDYVTTGASPIPVPAAVWLFGSALMGLLGLSKKSHIATV
jgi:hypothetical protein